MFVLVKDDGWFAFFWGISTGTISSLKSPSLVARSTFVMAAQGNLVHFLAADVQKLCDQFGGMPHDIWLSF